METLPPAETCPITRLLDITGDRWSFLIIRDVFYGVRRFDALCNRLGISKKILAARLKHLVEAEILKKVPYQERPSRFEYRLTAKGRELFPVLLTMMRWGERWLTEESMQNHTVTHLGCGRKTKPQLVCSHCHEQLAAARIRIESAE